ncbi:MAG: O-antigen ligase domain-containing protein [Comamonadaceae bacterium]|nr:MAG: O-antigen ligase domain-containing protein [Comamonadaceae bacterium]
MAIISIAKFLLIVACLCTLVLAMLRSRPEGVRPLAGAGADNPLARFLTPAVTVAILAAFSLSLFWTTGPDSDAYGSVAKYGKLLVIAALLALVRSRREATFALLAFMGTQIFLALSSWLLFLHVPLPWATSTMALDEYAVFSTYLDEGIITAAAGAVFWHLRGDVGDILRDAMGWRHGRTFAIAMAALCILNVLFVLRGRSGHVAAIAVVSMAVMWQLPNRIRVLAVALPFAVFALLYLSSDAVKGRATDMLKEVKTFSYSSPEQQVTSSGIRLMLWISSMTLIERHPVAGTGVGSFSTEYNALETARNPSHKLAAGNFNPHQEYLLWGVQLGIPGILLLLAFMVSLFRDSFRLGVASRRAVQSVTVAMAVACLFNSSLYDALIGDFFCVTLGLLLAYGWFTRPGAPPDATANRQPAGTAA